MPPRRRPARARQRVHPHRHRRHHHARVRRRRDGPGLDVGPGADPGRGADGRLEPDHGASSRWSIRSCRTSPAAAARSRGRYATLRNAGAAARELLIAAAMADEGRLPTATTTEPRSADGHAHVHPAPTWPYSALVDRRGDAARAGRPAPDRSRELPPDRQAAAARRHSRKDRRQREVRHRHLVPGHGVRGDQALPDDRRHARRRRRRSRRARIAVVPCTASDIARRRRGRHDQRGRRRREQHVARVAARQFAVGAVDAAGVDRPTSTARRSSRRRRHCWRAARRSSPNPLPPTGDTPASYAPVIEPPGRRRAGHADASTRPTRCPTSPHATMEVLNCTVQHHVLPVARRRRCEIWAPTQAAASVASLAAALTGLPAGADHRAHDVARRRARPQVRAGLREPGDPGRAWR